jgi:hypothetical protein
MWTDFWGYKARRKANRPLDVTKMLNFGNANRKLKLFPTINTPDLLTGTPRGLGRWKGS